ncbi:MAG: zinc-ribbon domain-containing protein, partial [Acidobacteriota bacterium]
MKIICPECQTEAAPGMKFCRNCGEKLPDVFSSATTVGEIPLPSPDLMQTVESPVLTPPKPPEAFKTV